MAKKKEPVEVKETEGYAIVDGEGRIWHDSIRPKRNSVIYWYDDQSEGGDAWRFNRWDYGLRIIPVRITPIGALDSRK